LGAQNAKKRAKVQQKMHIRKKSEKKNKKNNRFQSICINFIVLCELAHNSMMKVNTIRRSRFFIFFSSVLEYGLHFATVTSRRDPQFIVGGALEGTTKNAYTQIFDKKVYFLG
jgi:hypothetical protein